MSSVRSRPGPPIFSMIKDYYNKFAVISNNFLSDLECLDIKTKLVENQQLWQQSHVRYFNFFPLAMYLVDHYQYRNNVKIYKNVCNTLFSVYYARLLQTLSEKLQMELSYDDNLNYPGFHISNGVPMVSPNFHVDSFPGISKLLSQQNKIRYSSPKIFSIIVVVSTTEQNTGLALRNPSKNYLERNKLSFDEEYYYNKGMLAIWDGSIQHSIKPFIPIDANDYRITMQGHIAISGEKGIIFW